LNDSYRPSIVIDAGATSARTRNCSPATVSALTAAAAISPMIVADSAVHHDQRTRIVVNPTSISSVATITTAHRVSNGTGVSAVASVTGLIPRDNRVRQSQIPVVKYTGAVSARAARCAVAQSSARRKSITAAACQPAGDRQAAYADIRILGEIEYTV
jgi:hypothetical protein